MLLLHNTPHLEARVHSRFSETAQHKKTARLTMNWSAKWIWKKQRNYVAYNQTILARKAFVLNSVEDAVIRVSADSTYRLFINGAWVNDGPSRSWPEHFKYDEIDITPYLHKGTNEIRVIANCFGAGVMTRYTVQAGLLVQLDVELGNGRSKTIASDQTWEVAELKTWQSDTAKISLNMEGYELYDARLEREPKFTQAEELYDVESAPWQGLNPRGLALMSRKPFDFKAFRAAKIVRADGVQFTLPATRLMHPNLIEANGRTSMHCGMATVLTLKKKTTLQFETEGGQAELGKGLTVSVNGKINPSGRYTLAKGKHLILAMTDGETDHHGKKKVLRIVQPEVSAYTLENPVETAHENPWCFIPFKEWNYAKDDMAYFTIPDPEIEETVKAWAKLTKQLHKACVDQTTFINELGERAKLLTSKKMFPQDPHWKFHKRKVVDCAERMVENPPALMNDNAAVTVVEPSEEGDVELCYDLGEQNCGYYQLDLLADAGVCVDIAGVENVFENCRPQHTSYYRNSMRYVTKQGSNHFVSLKRRSGRYLFITLRNQSSAVKIRHIGLIESTYPVNEIGRFNCSDPRLDKIWEISARTLKLCMEDTFTDCPLYEQTFWVGDARNEALFAFSAFGATDIVRNGLTLAAQSLEHYPMVGSQVPTNWKSILPAWGFLWGIAVWDYYFYSGDTEYVRGIFPAVLQNIEGAEAMLDEHGLLSGNYWNMFDWTGADQDHETVTHNTMFFVGAIDAALKCADAIGEVDCVAGLKKLRSQLKRNLNALWDSKKQAYPDSIHADGSISPSTCQHTSFLSILYGIVEKKHHAAALNNVLNKPDDMVGIGSPFALLYLYEMMDQEGLQDQIIESIYRDYEGMLRQGATTVWEQLQDTRSHCHAWSSSPIYFLNRIILGVRQTAPGGTVFEISPMPNGLNWAEGVVATPHGPLEVKWEISGRKLQVEVNAPLRVEVRFKRNQSLKGLQIELSNNSN